MTITLTFLIKLLLIGLFAEQTGDRPIFISPLKIPLSLTSNFGELRTDHFHSGIDLRTQGVTGKEVVAAANGYIYRISVSPGGFGKALYMRHPNGYSTVYAHLDKFTPEIEEYLISRQYEEKSFTLTLWPPKESFRFEQGDVIAYSGNSGSSSGPHLHYEIRKTDGETPVNPFLFDFGISDNIKPVFDKLVIYPISENTFINDQNRMLRLDVRGSDGKYELSSRNEITISGPAGFGFRAHDFINGSGSRFSVHSIQLNVDNRQVFSYVMDEFSFNETRYINSHIDYETYMRDNIYIERAFRLPNDRLSVYRNLINRGIINFNDNSRHTIELTVSDMHGNRSVLSFPVTSKPSPANREKSSGQANSRTGTLMPFDRNNRFVTKDVAVNISTGTLYDTLWFQFGKSPGEDGMYSDIFDIHNIYTSLHKSYSLSLKPSKLPAGKESKLLILQIDKKGRKNPVSSSWDKGFVTASPRTFGTFFIGIDTVPPRITTSGFSSGVNLSGRAELRIKISDDLSGIKSYDPLIDGKWALFEYDQKNNVLIYTFDATRIRKGTKHTLMLKVTDNCDNESTLETEFLW